MAAPSGFPSRGQYHAHFVLQAQDGDEHVGIERRGIGLGGLFGQWAGLAFGTSVVDGDIQATKALDRLVNEIAHVVFAADIGAHEFRFGAKSAQFTDQHLPAIVVSTGDHDARTVLGECERGCAADAGKRSRDEYDWVGVHVPCPSGEYAEATY